MPARTVEIADAMPMTIFGRIRRVKIREDSADWRTHRAA
jgi:acyl-CoA synthetase (AMP-forming)/AMP-acid ligase II